MDLEKILGITAFSLDRLLEEDPDFLVRQKLQGLRRVLGQKVSIWMCAVASVALDGSGRLRSCNAVLVDVFARRVLACGGVASVIADESLQRLWWATERVGSYSRCHNLM